MNLRITEGISQDHLIEVYSDPYVRRCGFDGFTPEPVEHPAVTYLSAWVDGVFAGSYLAIRFTAHEMELHSYLLRKAVKASRELSSMAVDWCFSQGVNRVTAMIYEGLEKTVNLCRRLGFVYEGFKRECVPSNGRFIGVHVMGLTRADWGLK